MTRIAIALTPDFADWECALLMAVARSYLGVEILTASPDGNPLTSMGGLKVTPDIANQALDAAVFDALVIPGGLSWEKGEAPDLTGPVRAFHEAGKVVAGICAAASAIAATGILDAVGHTGNSLASHSKRAGYSGHGLYRDQPQAVSHARVITAPGSAPVTFTAEILKALRLWTPEAEAEIAAFAREHRSAS
jgi:putative intracellular protease/amidase